MEITRYFMGTNGVPRDDKGETPDDQILKMEAMVLYHRGNYVMDDGIENRARVKAMVGLVNRTNVLEVGYGMGLAFKELRRQRQRHVVIDIEPKVYTLAERYYPHRLSRNDRVITGDYANALSSDANGTHDCILIDTEEVKNLNELKRLLSSNGDMVMSLERAVAPSLRGFIVGEKKRYNYFTGDRDYRKRITRIARRQNMSDAAIDDLVTEHDRRHRKIGHVVRYRKT